MRGVGWTRSGGSRHYLLTIASGLFLIVIVARLADPAYEQVFSHLNTPDDEGYVTLTLRSFVDGNALYDDVYSQYGPGFYAFVGGAMDLLGIPFDNDGARWINLFLWLGSSLLASIALLRLTGSLTIAAVGLGIAFVVLAADALEPLHPGATIGFVLLLLVAAAAWLWPSRIPAALTTIGALTALLIAIKINVGGLTLIAVGFAAVVTSPELRRVRPFVAVITAVFVIVPFALMAPKLGYADLVRFGVVVSAGALALVLVTFRWGGGSRPNRRDLLWLAGGLVAMLVIVAAVPVILGTSPGGLVDGWLIRPAGHADSSLAAVPIHELGPVWAVSGLIAATVVVTRPIEPGPRLRVALALGRIVVGLGIWFALASPVLGLEPSLSQALVIATPLAWVASLGPGDEAPVNRFLRVLLPALAVLQTLHAYPMPGAQLAWSQVLFVIIGGVCVADGGAALGAEVAARRRLRVAVPVLVALAVVAFGTWFALDRVKPLTDAAHVSYSDTVPLDLPGARRVRVDDLRVAQLHELTAALRNRCKTFVTLPGMNSLYLYSGLPAPEELSSTWMLYFTTDEQQRIVDRLRATSDLCAVYKPDLLQFWEQFTEGRGIPDRPLVRYVEDEFHSVRNFEGYYLEVPNR
jgi:hypothetical protein